MKRPQGLTGKVNMVYVEENERELCILKVNLSEGKGVGVFNVKEPEGNVKWKLKGNCDRVC